MLEQGLAHVIASDGHGADGRPPDLMCALAAFEQRYEAPRDLFDWMTTGVPRRDPRRRAAAAAPAAAAPARAAQAPDGCRA